MTWEIKPSPSNGTKQSEIVLSFADFPGHYIGEYSDELAAHLRDKGAQPVKVVFEVTSDYGKVRGFHETEIAGLHDWESTMQATAWSRNRAFRQEGMQQLRLMTKSRYGRGGKKDRCCGTSSS